MSAVRTSTRSATPSSLGVAQRVLLRVASLVGPPDVDADGAAVRKQLGRGEQDRAAPAAEVEQRLVAAQPQPLEDLGPHLELADARGANEQRRRCHNGRTRPAGHRCGDGLTAHKTSGRRREQPRTDGPDDGRHRRRGHRAVIPVVPIIGLVMTKV
jgi:hypothetical protein